METQVLPFIVVTRTKASAVFAVVSIGAVIIALAAPLFVSRGVIQDLFFILTMLLLAQCWNLLAGYAGLISVGQQLFVGCGGYAMFGLVSLLGFDPVLAILAAGLFSALIAVPTAFFTFRLFGPYFAIGTWVIAEVGRLFLAQWKALGGGTGTSLPHEAVKDMIGIQWLKVAFHMKSSQASDTITYWLALILTVLTIGFIYRLLRSRQGLGLASVRDNELAARALGVDSKRMKILVYLVTAFITGCCGALIYVQKQRISPDAAFSVIDWTAYVIFIVVIGGIGSIEGPVIGVIVFFLLQNLLADYGAWYLLLLGAIAICTMLFAPRGLWGLFSSRTGIQLFPVRRILTGGPVHQNIKGGLHG